MTIATDQPSLAHQIWIRLQAEPKLFNGLCVRKLRHMPEFRDVQNNQLSAALSDLRKRGVIAQVDHVGAAFVYGAGPAHNVAQRFKSRVLDGKRHRAGGYKVRRGAAPPFELNPQIGMDLGANRARDDVRERQLAAARALPESVLEQALAERRAARARTV